MFAFLTEKGRNLQLGNSLSMRWKTLCHCLKAPYMNISPCNMSLYLLAEDSVINFPMKGTRE